MNISEFAKYFSVYECLSTDKKDENEIREYLENHLRCSSATLSRIIKSLRQDEVPMILSADGKFFIDEKESSRLLAEFSRILPGTQEMALVTTLRELNDKCLVLTNQNEKLQQLLEEESKKRKDAEKTIYEMKKEKDCRLFTSNVVFLDTVDMGPDEEFIERELITDFIPELDLDVAIEKHSKEKPLVEAVPDGKILNETNYRKKNVRSILTSELFRKRRNENEMKKTVEEVGYTQDKEAVMNQIVKNRYMSIQAILSNRRLSNQQKLSLYAFNSCYHGTDFESLIHFAADENIDANEFILLVESCDDEELKSVETMLRVLAKPSEVKQRLEFSKELVAGDWYIKAELNGKETKFVLVPEDEIIRLKNKMGLVHELDQNDENEVDDKMEIDMQEKREKNQTSLMKAPDFVPTYNVDEVNFDDYDFEDDVVDAKDFRGEMRED